ncbi:hypothetical protein [Pimelobacter simplex]|uniref:hypothetical protein n=1 Tax=Nocardioides simplex TaxID=2045 RepID=UPI00214FAB1C|nr:hypothetical protein [Pimelobacter simplex]UUW90201.1 hypothetical protein M0M43_01580 [Pimelobacter simplex]UUW94030.1 hypothetical protein M0M48_20090 [Pimelobacter simplex]
MTRVRTRGVAAAIAVATLATSCTAARPTSTAPPTEPPTSSSPSRAAPAPPVPDRLTTPLRDRGPVTGLDPRLQDLDLRDALEAPTLASTPIDHALLVADQNLFVERLAGIKAVNQIFVLAPDLTWRRIPLADYGDFHREPNATVSPDGRRVALSEGSSGAVSVIELGTGGHRRYPVPVDEAAGLDWSPDGRALMFTSRDNAGPGGYELDLRTGAAIARTVDVFRSTFSGDRRSIIEIGKDPTGAAEVRCYRDGKRTGSRLLEYSTIPRSQVTVKGYAAFGSFPTRRQRAAGHRDGAVVVDPRDGRLVAMGVDPRFRATWTAPDAWITADLLAVYSTLPGVLRVWNVRTGEVRRLARFRNEGVNVSLAPEPVADLLAEAGR